MSLRPSILINPNYATNGISSDTQQAGWYQVSPTSSNLALRTSYSNIGISGEIRLNTSVLPNVFQGNNGYAWVTFNATQGPTGPSGKDFTNAVNFNNLGSNVAAGSVVPLASVFSTTFSNVAASLSNVNIRSLQGSTYLVNSNLTVDSTILTQNSNIITIASQPIPYQWNFSNSGSNTVAYLKNSSIDTKFYGWGDTSSWIVKQGVTITKGQAVCLTSDTYSSNIVIMPVTYTSLAAINPFVTPFNMLGIATQSASGGSSCIVCTRGITTALCTTNIDSTYFSYTTEVTNVGVDGIVGKDGGIFCATQLPICDYIRAGYFLEKGVGIASNSSNVLFYVDIKVQIG